MKGRKLGLKSTIWNKRNKQTFNWNKMKKKEFKKNEDRLRNLWDNFKHSNIRIIWVPEGEGKTKKLKTYMKK